MALHQLLPVGACFILMLDFRVLQRWRTVTLGLASVGLLVQALPHPCLGVVTLSTMTVTFSSFYHIFISHPASIASLALPRHSSSWAGQSMINPHFFFTCCVHHLRYFSDFLVVQQAGSEDEAASSSGEPAAGQGMFLVKPQGRRGNGKSMQGRQLKRKMAGTTGWQAVVDVLLLIRETSR